MAANVTLSIEGYSGLPDRLPVSLRAILFNKVLESESLLVPGPQFKCELTWVATKRHIKSSRANQVHVRLEAFTNKKLIGLAMLPLRSAQMMKGADKVIFSWVRLTRVPDQFKAGTPALNVSLSVVDQEHIQPQAPAVVPPCPLISEVAPHLPAAEPASNASCSGMTSSPAPELISAGPSLESWGLRVTDPTARVDIQIKQEKNDDDATVPLYTGVLIEDVSESEEANVQIPRILVGESLPSTSKVVESTMPKDNPPIEKGIINVEGAISALAITDYDADVNAEGLYPLAEVTVNPTRYRRFVVEIVLHSIHWKQPIDCQAVNIIFVHPRRLSERKYRAEIDLSQPNLSFANVVCRLIFVTAGAGDEFMDKFGPSLYICDAKNRIPLAEEVFICFHSIADCNGKQMAFAVNTYQGLRLCKVYIKPSVTELSWETEVPTTSYDLLPVVMTDDCFTSNRTSEEGTSRE